MKKRIAVYLMSTFFLGSSLLNSVITVYATIDSQIREQDGKISELRDREAEAQRQVDEAQARVDDLLQKESDLTSSITRHRELAQQLGQEIADRSLCVVKRQRVIDRVARHIQTEGDMGKFGAFLHALTTAEDLTDIFSKTMALSKIHSAQTEMLKKQKTDLEKIKQQEAEVQRRIAMLETDLAALEKTKIDLVKETGALEAARVELEIQREGEEGKKAELMAQKVEIEAKAREEAARKEEEARIREEMKAQSKQKPAVTTPSSKAMTSSSSTSTVAAENKAAPQEVEDALSDVAVGRSGFAARAISPIGNMDCVAYVRAKTGISIPGNAGQWATNAMAMGYHVSSTPTPGAIICWSPGVQGASGLGHVGLVSDVVGNTVITDEGNFNGGIGSRVIPATATTGVYYISK